VYLSNFHIFLCGNMERPPTPALPPFSPPQQLLNWHLIGWVLALN
jgi:hypothetical protein